MNKIIRNTTKRQTKYIKKTKVQSSILSMGELNLDYELILKEEDIQKQGLTFESLNDITQILFIKENKSLWKQILIKAKTSTLNTLLFLNSTRKTKIPIEFIAYRAPQYTEQEQFISEIIAKVSEAQGIVFNYSNILPSSSNLELTFTIRCNNAVKTFSIGNEGMILEHTPNGNNTPLLQPIIQNDNSPLSNIILHKQQYSYFFIDYYDLMAVNKIKDEDFVDFIFWLKKKCATSIIISYPNISQLFTSKENIVQIFHLWYLTDIFIQTLNDANENFNTFNKYNGRKEHLEENDIDDFWEKKIAINGFKMIKNCALASKINCVINENGFISLTEVSPESEVNHFQFDFKPYPKMTYQNVSFIEKFKSKFNEDKKYYLSVFIGGFLGRLCKSTERGKSIKVIYPSYLAGMTITKRIIGSLMINTSLPPLHSYYIIKLDKNKITEYINQLSNEKKEKKFVLDCLNETHSQMKYYVPLIDENISSFLTFGKRKELKTKGFINDKDYIVYDPIYRSVLGASFLYDKSPKITTKDIQNEIKAKENNNCNCSNTFRSSSVTDMKLPPIKKRQYIRTIKSIYSIKEIGKHVPTLPSQKY